MEVSERIEVLERLAALHQSGVLTDVEFEAQKAKLFGSTQSANLASDSAPFDSVGAEGVHEVSYEYYDDAPDRQSGRRILFGVIAAGALAFGGFVLWKNEGFGLWGSKIEVNADGLPILDDIITFSDPKNCDFFSDIGSRIFHPLVRGESIEEPLLMGFPITQDAPYGGGMRMNYIRINGVWHGLKVSRLVTSYWKDSDIDGFEVRFLEPKEKVISEFRKIGFDFSSGKATVLPMPSADEEMFDQCEYGVYDLNGGSTFRMGYSNSSWDS